MEIYKVYYFLPTYSRPERQRVLFSVKITQRKNIQSSVEQDKVENKVA